MKQEPSNNAHTFFTTQNEAHKWFLKYHNKEKELLVGFYKTKSGIPSITYKEMLDEALCFGWIDGIRKSVDEVSYTIRFTPRRAKSIWSAVNIKRANELKQLGLMQPVGLQTFDGRDEKLANKYSFEQKSVALAPEYEKEFKKNKKAWEFFLTTPPSYKTPAIWWVISAKQEETRLRRLALLIKDSEAGERIPLLRKPVKKK